MAAGPGDGPGAVVQGGTDGPDLAVRALLRSLVERRRELRLSQTQVAARMGTSQSALARIEAGEVDPRISTVERYAFALGDELAHQRGDLGAPGQGLGETR
jgi:transcriptional regulator with XRE-family HTH domain